jgi:hypothetical protein
VFLELPSKKPTLHVCTLLAAQDLQHKDETSVLTKKSNYTEQVKSFSEINFYKCERNKQSGEKYLTVNY